MEPVFVTAEGLKKIEDELVELKTKDRPEIADRIRVALQQGDLSENAEYQEAKEAQALTEQRIVELDEKVKQAKVIKKTKGTVAKLGSSVEVSSEMGKATYAIVGGQEANPTEGRISNESPLGKALLGHEKGDEVKVMAPNGEIVYKVVSVE